MSTRTHQTPWLAMRENQSALAAVRNVLHALVAGASAETANPLYVHGLSGTGKTALLDLVLEELGDTDLRVRRVTANDFAAETSYQADREADLLIVEDLQHLPTRFVPALVATIDYRVERDLPLIVTATHGPAQLTHRGARVPRRLTNRLASGLVVQIEPMGPASRRRMLEALAAGAGISVAPEIVSWLAVNLVGGGRQLQGAIARLKTLQRGQRKPLQLDTVQQAFTPALELPVRRIVERVAVFFDVRPQQLLSSRRSQTVLMPRQVSMYLARQLTPMSLKQIGAYFGGRDHTTVQHACAKIEAALKRDPALSSTVRELCAQLH